MAHRLASNKNQFRYHSTIFTFDQGLFGMNHRMGKIKDISRLDGSFFGMLKQLGDTIDPHSRILLETTYEAIIDAGIQTFNILV